MEEILSKIYYDASNPGSYGGVESLYREAVKQIPSLRKKDIENWLQGQLVYTLHKNSRRRFKRNPVIAEHVNENFQADLVDMQEFASQNNNYRYILTVIDVFSKYVWAIPLKNKQALSVSKAIENVLKEKIPFKLQTDKGKEFENNAFKEVMNMYDINHFTSTNKEIKCSIVERFNRTLKKKMFMYFTKTGKRRYVGILPSLIKGYNNSYHRSIKMAPTEVNEKNEKIVFQNLYGFKSRREMLKKLKSPKLKIGEKVRRKYILGPLDRGYYPNWTDNIYTVDKTISGINKPLYRVSDSKGGVIKQRLYPEEVQKVKDNNIYRVEKILSEKIINGKKYYRVKWLNHPSAENSWVKSKDIFKIDGE